MRAAICSCATCELQRNIRRFFYLAEAMRIDTLILKQMAANRRRRYPHVAHRALGRELRARQIGFRREEEFSGYFVDFFIPRGDLAVELDGKGHNPEHDKVRDQRIAEQNGVTVLRFPNDKEPADIIAAVCAWIDNRKESERQMNLDDDWKQFIRASHQRAAHRFRDEKLGKSPKPQVPIDERMRLRFQKRIGSGAEQIARRGKAGLPAVEFGIVAHANACRRKSRCRRARGWRRARWRWRNPRSCPSTAA